MSHSHTNRWKTALFRAFVTNQYYANRDEYHDVGEEQPHTFEQYYRNNIAGLKESFRKHKKEVDKTYS